MDLVRCQGSAHIPGTPSPMTVNVDTATIGAAMSTRFSLVGFGAASVDGANTTEKAQASIASIGTYQVMAMAAAAAPRRPSSTTDRMIGIWNAMAAVANRPRNHVGRGRPMARPPSMTEGHITAPPAPRSSSDKIDKRHHPRR